MYQLTCICGKTMVVGGDALGRAILCEHCQRTVVPLLAQLAEPGGLAAAPSANTPAAAADNTKACPICGERIAAAARKCRWCGEYLDTPSATAAQSSANFAPAASFSTETVFSLHTSQWDNFWRYLICFCIAALGAAGFFIEALKPYQWTIFLSVLASCAMAVLVIYVHSRRIETHISPMRIEKQSGILSKKIDWVSMPSVVDLELRQGLLQRILGVGTIVIRSNDTATPEMVLYQLPKARKVFRYLQEQVSLINQRRLSKP
ncbi:MAG: PH domain-containing protein [Phycisphaerales bacterium]|nr:PH domain-containing protein [Phycisphaerales bacterium]